jgi:hypothetical protein
MTGAGSRFEPHQYWYKNTGKLQSCGVWVSPLEDFKVSFLCRPAGPEVNKGPWYQSLLKLTKLAPVLSLFWRKSGVLLVLSLNRSLFFFQEFVATHN